VRREVLERDFLDLERFLSSDDRQRCKNIGVIPL
jgi:hypothetical protein